jgi:hypothetical protein
MSSQGRPDLKDVPSTISGGRGLPSKVSARISAMVEAKDRRVVDALEGRASTDIPRGFNKIALGNWQERIFMHAIDDLDVGVEELYRGIDICKAKELSQEETERMTINRINLTYGEVCFKSLAMIVSKNFDLPRGGIFYDCGSGSGRGVFSAAFMHDFEKCIGIEIVQGLHDAAVERLERFNTLCRPQLEADAQEAGRSAGIPEFKFIRSDFRDVNWTDATLVWANSTCFDTTLMNFLSYKSEEMKEGSYFITLTKKLNSSHWELVCESTMYNMSWGGATVHAHRKVMPARAPDPDMVPGADPGASVDLD